MKHKSTVILFALVTLILLSVAATGLADEPELVEVEGGEAEVTLVEGKAELFRKKEALRQTLSEGDLLRHGDCVTTGDRTRIELAMPDGSFLRFDEKTTFELISAGYDQEAKQRDIEVRLALGKTWAKVAELVGGRGRFQVSAKNAIAGVRGTTYRMDVNPDSSVVVKVYWGQIHVSPPPKSIKQSARVSKPKKVEGPYPVEGPHPVTRQEWTYIIRAMHQIVIRPDGTALKPFRFDPKVDADDWVRWNQMRDRMR
ncbi:MAG: FecR domain-containing protein [Deltaproteobacteria bacterium]|nr:FecR domain-containing protein [Deltaproteobacteria bacterium]MBW2019831.1 FecR domain-containing protein [Deltaproteobacteria bacterium]MBW2074635.1 FecR domain-containing protein [Deltaproteobacteria bacterium]RLB81993.1 MAG: hypothetical protein DRH17_07370 [Deltaproteobacteria bacterium]